MTAADNPTRSDFEALRDSNGAVFLRRVSSEELGEPADDLAALVSFGSIDDDEPTIVLRVVPWARDHDLPADADWPEWSTTIPVRVLKRAIPLEWMREETIHDWLRRTNAVRR